MRFSPSFLDDIRARVRLVDIVGRKVKLTRRGGDYVGLCPFHKEKTPSFNVVEDKGFYHCFGCGAHGDAFRFLTDSEGVSFPEAVERLAAEAGLPMPQRTADDVARDQRRASLSEVMETVAGWYESQLMAGSGRVARDYLSGRGVGDEARRQFRLGFAPPGRTALKEAMLARAITEAQLIECGMLIKPDDGAASYDRFRNRLMFPITNMKGQVIAFGGRALDAQARAKYLNSPETVLFHKGHELYNARAARKAARECGRLIVVEGYMDVIALAEQGIEEAVAPLGTALTETQIAILWRLAAEPVLCFDGDKAGIRAAHRAIDRALPALKAGHSLRFALLPEGEDPDSLVRRSGPAAINDHLDRAQAMSDLLFARHTETAVIDTPERKAAVERALMQSVAAIGDETVKTLYRRDFKDRLWRLFNPRHGGFDRRAHAADHRRASRPAQARHGAIELGRSWFGVAGQQEAAASQPFDQLALAIILNHPALLVRYLEEFAEFHIADRALARLQREILFYTEQAESLDRQALHTHLTSQGFMAELASVNRFAAERGDWVARPEAALIDADAAFMHILARHRLRVSQAERTAAEAALGADPDEAAWQRYRALIEEIQQSAGQESDIDGYGLASQRRQS